MRGSSGLYDVVGYVTKVAEADVDAALSTAAAAASI